MWQLCGPLTLRCAADGPSLSISWQLGQAQTDLPVYLLLRAGGLEVVVLAAGAVVVVAEEVAVEGV